MHGSLKQWHLSCGWTFRSLLHASWGGTQLRVEHANPVSKTLCSVGSWWEAGFTCQRFWDGQIGQEAIPPCLWCQPSNTVRDRWIQSHCLEMITEHMQFHRDTRYISSCIYYNDEMIERWTCFSRPMQLPIHLLLTAYRSLLMRVRNRRGQKWLKVRVITLLFLIDKLLQHLRFRHMNMILRLTLISKEVRDLVHQQYLRDF